MGFMGFFNRRSKAAGASESRLAAPYTRYSSSPRSDPSVVDLLTVPVEFRTNMGGSSLRWRKGNASVTSQGFGLAERGGGMFIQDWGTIRNIDVPVNTSPNLITVLGFDGTMMQAVARDVDLPLTALAAWSTLQPARVEKGGATMEFHPGAWQMPAVLTVAGQWSGGEAQARQAVREWAKTVNANVTMEQVERTRASLLPKRADFANDAEREGFWDARARRVVQRELDLLDAEMRDITYASTRGAILSYELELLAPIWLAVTHERELWLLFFPALDEMFRPSVGPGSVVLALPGDKEALSGDPRDCEPGVLARFNLSRVQALEVLPDKDGRGGVVLQHGNAPGSVIEMNTQLKEPLVIGVDGEVGWQGVRLVLDLFAR